ncbi:MAG: 3-dehydroquinate synthase, partial [Acidimicrobiales bacterium]
GYDLALDLPPGLEPADLVDLMARDKKATRGLTFVLDGPRGLEVVAGVDGAVVADTLVEVASTEPAS